MDSVSEHDLARLEALERAATPGPWYSVVNDLIGGQCIRTCETTPGEDDGPEESARTVLDMIVQDEDADYVAALRNAAPWLLAQAREAERLREQVSKEQWRVSDIAQALYDMCNENDALAARLAEMERLRSTMTFDCQAQGCRDRRWYEEGADA